MNKNRVEAITDGIVAIAATIMVLELKIPNEPTLNGFLNNYHIFLSYIISFFIIYISWHGHHTLFNQVEKITSRTYLVNGIWIFFLTLVPFTTSWVGAAPNKTMPSFLYALNLLLWSISFHILDYQMRKHNPTIVKDFSMTYFDRLLIYGGYSLCLIFSFIFPFINMIILVITTLILLFQMFSLKY